MIASTERLRVLQVGTDAAAAADAAERLEAADERLDVEPVGSAEAALTHLGDAAVDCVVSHAALPDETGLELLERVRTMHPNLPFVLVAPDGSEALASEAISAGVTDYVGSADADRFDRLAERVVDAVQRARSARNYREVFENAGVGLTIRDVETAELLDANDRYCELLGYELDELRALPVGELVADVDAFDIDELERATELAREEGSQALECPLETSDGDVRWTDLTITTIELDGTERFLTSIRDITDRKAALRELEAERNRFVQGPTVVFKWGIGSEWPVEYVSPNADSLLGYDKATLESEAMGYADLIHWDDIQRVAAEVEAAIESEAERVTHEPYRVRTAEGDVRWVLDHTVIEWDDGEPAHFLGYLVDITERKEFERGLTALQAAAEDLWAATDRREVFDVLLETAVEFLSFEYLRVALREDDELVMLSTEDAEAVDNHAVSVPLESEQSLAVRAYRDGEAILTRDLDPSAVASVDAAYRSALTVPLGDWGVLQAFGGTPNAFDERDRELTELLAEHIRITLTRLDQDERMRDQREALRRENERLEDFVRIVSHDLRNPLNVVDGHLELARTDGEAHIDKAADALERAFELIDDLLALAREGESVSDLETVDLGDTAERCWLNVETADATLDVRDRARVRGDPSRLQQLLENLFRNAVEHAGTDVTISVGTLPDGFYVADDGPGIPDGERDEVFEVGYSTVNEGTGFGLSIVQHIAEAHDWDVRVTESEAGGARFEVTGVQVVD